MKSAKIEVDVAVLVDPKQIEDEPVTIKITIKDQSDAGFLD